MHRFYGSLRQIRNFPLGRQSCWPPTAKLHFLTYPVGADDSVRPQDALIFMKSLANSQLPNGPMCTGKRQTHIRNAPSSRTAVTGIGPYNQTGKCLRIRPKFSVSQMHSVGRTESSAPTASRVSASSVPHRFICHKTIVAATAAFKDSQRGDMGMMIFCSAAANSSG